LDHFAEGEWKSRVRKCILGRWTSKYLEKNDKDNMKTKYRRIVRRRRREIKRTREQETKKKIMKQ
jgi:hypothetical protein